MGSVETLRLRLSLAGPAEFEKAWAKKVLEGLLFLPTRRAILEGTTVRFELQDQLGERLLLGEGEVVRPAPSHMGEGVLLRLKKLDAVSKLMWSKLSPSPGPSSEQTQKKPRQREEEEVNQSQEAAAPVPTAAAAKPQIRSVPEPAEAHGRDPEPKPGAPNPEEEQARPILGIDLGTCRVLAAVADEKGAHCLPLDKAGRGMPAVVASGKGAELLVGASALARRLSHPGETVFGSKPLLGRRYHSAELGRLAEALPFSLVSDTRGGVAVQLGDQTLDLCEVNAQILGAVKEGSARALGHPVTQVVISVPALFGDAGRAAVREAAERAGLEVVRMVAEPSAAAIAYGYGRGLAARRLLVLDLGGGTFDVSLLHVSGDRFEVIASGGDSALGGLDFDLTITKKLMARVERRGGPAQLPPPAFERLLTEAERLKISLSEKQRAVVSVDTLWCDEQGNAQELALELEREELEDWIRPLVERCLSLAQALLQREGLAADQIDDILLVGAQTRTPLFRTRVEQVFGQAPLEAVDPEQAVALGCAIVARSIRDAADPRTATLELQEVLTLGIGLGLSDGSIAPVLEQGTPVPAHRTVRIATQTENQELLEVALMQGNTLELAQADYLGSLRFADLPRGPAGSVELILSFALDVEGLLKVSAKDSGSGREVEHQRSTVESLAELQENLRNARTEILDLKGLIGTHPVSREGSGLLRGLRRLFRGGA